MSLLNDGREPSSHRLTAISRTTRDRDSQFAFIADQYLNMLAKILGNRLARTLLWGGLGAASGYGFARGGLLLACYMVDHTAWEQIWAGWSLVIFTIAYGITGAIYGFTSARNG